MPRKISPLFEDLVEQYIENHAKRNKRSWRFDQSTFENYWLPAFEGRMVHTITRRDIVETLDTFRKHPKSGKEELGPVLNRYFAVCRKMFNWAISQALIEDNPCKMVTLPVKERSRKRVLDMPEYDKILDALERDDIGISKQMKNAIKLLILIPARRSEICGMRWDEISLRRSLWTIPEERTKNGEPRIIPLSKQAVEILKSIPQHNSYVFPHRTKRHDRPMTADSINHACNKIRKVVSLRDWRPHDFRRSAGTHIRRLGCDRHTLKLILGHTMSSVTDIYDRYDGMDDRTLYLQKWADEVLPTI